MDDAPQHRPRPLPLFLHMLRSEAGDDPERIAAVLRGVRAYQAATRGPTRHLAPEIARVGRTSLRDYGGAGRTVVLVPSLINPSTILDLDEERSLARWLTRQGLRVLLVDWGSPDGGERSRTIAGHVTDLLLPLLRELAAPPILLGYCLGGTIAIAAAALIGAPALALLATPWRFSRYSDDTRALMRELWTRAQPASERIGLLPIEVLQAAFWEVDRARTLDKYAAFGRAADDAEAVRKFVAVEDWANAGAPLTHGAARELFENMLQDDAPGDGRWMVGGRAIEPAAYAGPMLEIVSTSDRIVPAAAAAGVGDRFATGLGHVGMIVSERARDEVWAPLARWLLATS